MTTVSKAIKAINSNAKFTVNGDNDADTADIVWLEGTTEISKANIKTKMAELQTEYNSLAYARKRALEYPSIQDFMEAYTEKEIGESSTKWNAYKTAYNKVRSDNPKE